MSIVNAVIGWMEKVSRSNTEESGKDTNNVDNSKGERVYEWVIQSSFVMS